MTWVSLHVFHHGDLDVLLRDAVRPLVAGLRQRELIDGFFFLRYWDGGRHLRLRLRSVSDVDGPVLDLAVAWLREYLAANPAPDLNGYDGYAETAAELAAGEGVTDYLPEPMPNNTVHPIPYVPEIRRYGTGESLAAVERHFVESSRIALGLIIAGTTRDQRHTAALAALLLTWTRREPRRPAYDPAYEARYTAQLPALRAVAARVAEIVDGSSTLPEAGALSAWWRSIRDVSDRRIADVCAHLLCNRLGIGLADERYVRYLAARVATSPAGGP